MNNIEFEYKIIISHAKYNELKNYLNKMFENSTYTQNNIYFDTPNQLLKNNKSALRIRTLNNKLEWTLKRTVDEFKKIEIKQNTNNASFKTISTPILSNLQELGVEIADLDMICEISTNRTDYNFYGSTLSLDFSTFNNSFSDYELELEIDNEDCIPHFNKLIQQFNIEHKIAKSKVARALTKQI